MKNAVVIGASSGVGKAVAKVLAEKGYAVGLAARRVELLQELQQELGPNSKIKQLDLLQPEEAMQKLTELIAEMGEVDLFVIDAGVVFYNKDFEWEKDLITLRTNVLGFAAMAHTAMEYLLKQGTGHIVGVTALSAIRGESTRLAYNASKAFASNYLEGLRVKAYKEKKAITVTEVQPGWIDTDMAKGRKTFWMATPEAAARQIYSAIEHKRAHAYITRRWRLYAWLLKLAPRWAYERFLT